MRKLILLLLSGMLSTACVDKDYDLGNIDTDNIAIGDEGSQFRIPLVKVLVSKDEIKNNGGNIEEIFREADIWFPSQLPDGKFVDLVKLQDKDDQTYVNTLLERCARRCGPATPNSHRSSIWFGTNTPRNFCRFST